VLLIGRLEREYLADRTGLVTAAYMTGSEVQPESLDDALAKFNEALIAVPAPETDRERTNRAFLKAISA
jgi:hypothetical protein